MGRTGVMSEAVISRPVFFIGELSPSPVLATAFDRTASKSRDVWNAWYASGCTASKLHLEGKKRRITHFVQSESFKCPNYF
jgi:hypothetical protein